jgi:hypothetical protein
VMTAPPQPSYDPKIAAAPPAGEPVAALVEGTKPAA